MCRRRWWSSAGPNVVRFSNAKQRRVATIEWRPASVNGKWRGVARSGEIRSEVKRWEPSQLPFAKFVRPRSLFSSRLSMILGAFRASSSVLFRGRFRSRSWRSEALDSIEDGTGRQFLRAFPRRAHRKLVNSERPSDGDKIIESRNCDHRYDR